MKNADVRSMKRRSIDICSGRRNSALSLSILLGACSIYSSATMAFLCSSRHFSSRRNNNRDYQDPKKPLSRLAFYPSDEPFANRLKRVQDAWDNVVKEGIPQFLSDELDAAEKIVKGNVDNAQLATLDDTIKGESGIVDGGKNLASEITDLRQEFDELKAVKMIEETTEEVMSTIILLQKDLENSVHSVISSVEKAEETVRSVIVSAASIEGLAPVAKEVNEELEAKAQAIESAIKVADSAAETAKQVIAKK